MPERELETMWKEICGEVRQGVTDMAFHLWLAPLQPAHLDEAALHVRAPRHIRTLVQERYLGTLNAAGRRVLRRPVSVRIEAEDWAPPQSDAAHGHLRSRRPDRASSEPFNPKYTFDQFVIAEGNWLAHAAALAVAEQPAQTYNPLFLHGPPGLGKTHLLQAIGNYLRLHGSDLAVRYTTSDEFTDDFVRAIRRDGTDEFKARFRGADVLLIDDVQFLADRTRTQEEFFHTFNRLFEAGCQLVMTSDRAPGELTTFERRLTERFASGLVVSVDPPELEARVAILRKRAVVDGLSGVDDSTLMEVARTVDASVRALEGALIRVIAYASLRGATPTPALARSLLERLHGARDRPPYSIEQVQTATATALQVPRQALLAHDRRPAHTFARQVAMYLARELTDASLPSIGADFGGRGHSTVLHAHRRIAGELRPGSPTTRAVQAVREALSEATPDRCG